MPYPLSHKYPIPISQLCLVNTDVPAGVGAPPLDTTAACQNLPLAGRVSHFMGNNYTGLFGPQLCKRLHNKPTEQASPTCPSQGAKLLKRGNSEPFQGGSEYGRQECNIQSLHKTRRFPITTVHGSKKRWGPKPIINLKRLNSFVHTEHFKMEGIHMLKDLLKPNDWMTKVNLKDTYYTSSDKPQKVAAVQVARRNLSVQLSPFQVVVGSVDLHQDYKADCSHPGLRMIIYIDDILILSETESVSR